MPSSTSRRTNSPVYAMSVTRRPGDGAGDGTAPRSASPFSPGGGWKEACHICTTSMMRFTLIWNSAEMSVSIVTTCSTLTTRLSLAMPTLARFS